MPTGPTSAPRPPMGFDQRSTLPTDRPAQVYWPLSAAACQLAISAHALASVAYQHDERVWTDLSSAEKQAWIARAAEWLHDVEPEKCIACSARYKVAGSDYCGDTCAIFAETDR